MALQSAILLALLASIWLIVLSLGTRAGWQDLTYLARRPGLLARSMIALFVVTPAFAIFMSAAFDLQPEIRFALVALTASPVPPLLHLKQMKVDPRGDYPVGLLVAAACASLLATPLLVATASRVLDVEAQVSAARVVRPLLISIGLPLAVGLALRSAAPGPARAIGRYAQMIGSALLVVGLVALLVSIWPSLWGLMRNGAVVAIAATVAFGLAAGHLLGGGRERVSGPLALAAVSRHPGVAMAIAADSFPAFRGRALAGVLLFLLLSALLTAPYVWWVRRSGSERAGAAPAPQPPGAGTVT